MPAIGSTFNIVVTFRDSSDALVNPDAIIVETFDSDGYALTSATPDTPEWISTGKYLFTWTPTEEGVFTVSITGEVAGEDDIVVEMDFTITTDNEDSTAPSLDEDVVITFSSGFIPLLVDPESISVHFDEASLLEISQLVNKFSLEVEALFPTGSYPAIAYEYVEAATLCGLSRLYDGIGGASNYSGFTLGDLQVQNSQGSSKSSKNRGGASTWCELAEILRREMRAAKGGIKSAQKAGYWISPVPRRRIK